MEHYTYIHKDPRTNEIKYVGKGKGNRYKELGKRRFAKHLNWIKSLISINLSPICEILEYFETEKEAYAKEKELIAFYRDQGIDLKNMADGGRGGISGKENQNYGIFETPMAKANRRKIVCITTGEFFNSLTEAANKYKTCTSKISLVCQLKRHHTAGLIFRYEGEEHLIFKRKKRRPSKTPHMPSHRKRVLLVELNIVFEKIMDGVRFCKEQGRPIDRSGIRGAISGKNKTAGGYTWRFA